MTAGSRILLRELDVLRLLLLGLPGSVVSICESSKGVEEGHMDGREYVSPDLPSTGDTWGHVCSHMGQEELLSWKQLFGFRLASTDEVIESHTRASERRG